jgi:hypothetical protein
VDEELLLKVIVHTLLQRPGEWFTYNRMAQDIDLPGVDATLVGAFVDFREDLFATSQDRRFKLQTKVVEQIVQSGIRKWKIPNRTERKSPWASHSTLPSSADSSAIHYCHSSDAAILDDLKEGRVPEIGLVTSCCWKRICQVRGRNLKDVADDVWQDVCRERGYLLARENPRGF